MLTTSFPSGYRGVAIGRFNDFLSRYSSETPFALGSLSRPSEQIEFNDRLPSERQFPLLAPAQTVGHLAGHQSALPCFAPWPGHTPPLGRE